MREDGSKDRPGAAPAGRSAWLVLGGLHLLNGTRPLDAADPIVLVPLAAPIEQTVPGNTIVLRWSDLGTVEMRARTVGDAHTHTGTTDGAELFPRMLPGPRLRKVIAAVSGTPEPMPIVPLFYVSGVTSGSGTELHVYSQIRFLAEDACFIRITPKPITVTAPDSLDWLAEAVRGHADHFLFLNNHQRYYRKCFDGRELEYKYTLTPPVDVWSLTVELYQKILDGGLPGYVMEYRDEFQAWDYLNHLYDVTAPEPERGYVSFIPTTDGKHLVKRKWYANDAFDRRESHTYGVAITEEDFDRYISEELGVTAIRLPSFRRVRYDVNFESTRTGHVYGIFFDHCSLVDARDVVLHQCELEYLRSRIAVEPDEKAVLEEIEMIADWLEAFLRDKGLNDARGYYSKRTFLKDAVAARPELAVGAR